MKNWQKSLAWTFEFTASAEKQLEALSGDAQQRILKYLYRTVATHPNPKSLAKALQGSRYEGQFRFRAGDYRVICRFEDHIMVILVLNLGHRSRIYLR